MCTKLTCSVIYKKCPVAKWEDSVRFFFDDRDVATAITAWYIPIIRHLLQHIRRSARWVIVLCSDEDKKASVKLDEIVIYWER